ncbi:MAG TPA: hypothetical protein PKW95_07920 [bacterium]|nr:hypothetical protein [bacterium]
MQYKLKIGESIADLEFTPEEKGRFTARVGEETFAGQAHAPQPHRLHVQLDGAPALDVYTAPSAEGLWVWTQGRARLVQDAERTERRTSRRGGGGAKEVTPPTPATVVALTAEVGQRVAKGDALVVVSAMKMEFTLTAPYAGEVTAVNTKVGEKANPGDILVEIAPAEEQSDG